MGGRDDTELKTNPGPMEPIDLVGNDIQVEAGDKVKVDPGAGKETALGREAGSESMRASPSTPTRFSEDRCQLLEPASAATPAATADLTSRLSASAPGGSGPATQPEPRSPSHPRTASEQSTKLVSRQMGQPNSTPHKSHPSTNTSGKTDAGPTNVSPRPSSSAASMAHPTTMSPSRPTASGSQRASISSSPLVSHTPRQKDWPDGKIENSLFELTKELDRNHAKLVHHSLRVASRQKAPERRHQSAKADLADLRLPVLPGDSKQQDTMKVQLKLHKDKDPARVNAGKKKLAYGVTCIKSDKKRVPKYRFHHVEISRNILSPNTSLKFIPHLRDMKDNEEERYRRWINELEAMDVQSGFNVTSSNRAQKAIKMLKEETAIDLSLYINRWIAKLGLEDCSKASLVGYMATQPENNDKMTPQQKNSIMNRLSDDVASPKALRAAKMFTDAFNNLWKHTELSLKDVLVHDETVEAVVENKKLVKDGKADTEKQGAEQLLETVEGNLLSYTILGCLFCYSHSCEHGDHDRDNHRRPIGVELIGKFGGLMRQNLAKYAADPSRSSPDKSTVACRSNCYILYRDGNPHAAVDPWTEDELLLLRGLFIALGATTLHLPCLASALLGRSCWDVYRKALQLGLDAQPLQQLAGVDQAPPKTKGVPWYDRFRKELKHDWQEHLNAHEFTRREIRDPCNHPGPCGKGCPCVDAKLLCDRFCRCTAENCAYKYTGCACHSSGKTCLQQKTSGRPCICVQLNRECDPVLCSGCGALERADPKNAHDIDLHATGCQNVALQRGVSKSVLLGESQIDDCGYGLFAAEDIAQDDFVIEYLGELISHDEGVRREARRGDVFDEKSHSSYLFTLLDYEGIWVDAAIYGNLSRYINHASEADKVGRKRVNIIPQILFVNGDFRIKFKALRDIKAGEELFFNYGENFPNLTKQLLDAKDEDSRPKRGGSRRGGRGGRGRGGRGGRGRGRGGGVKYGAETKKAPMPPLASVATVSLLEDEEDVALEHTTNEDDDEDDYDFNPRRVLKHRRGGAVSSGRGGARKRKRELLEYEDSIDTDSASPVPRPRGGRGSRGGRVRARGRGGSRRGGRVAAQPANGGSVTTNAAFALEDASDSNGGSNLAASIPASPHAILGTPSSRTERGKRRRRGGDADNSDFKTAVQRSGSSHHSPSLRRRRRQIPDSDDEMPDAPHEELRTPTRQRKGSSDDGSMDDGSSSLDRSQRRRQRPARYRDSEE